MPNHLLQARKDGEGRRQRSHGLFAQGCGGRIACRSSWDSQLLQSCEIPNAFEKNRQQSLQWEKDPLQHRLMLNLHNLDLNRVQVRDELASEEEHAPKTSAVKQEGEENTRPKLEHCFQEKLKYRHARNGEPENIAEESKMKVLLQIIVSV